jgi:hypothetical protein
MAVRPQVPNWNNINLNKPEEYSAEFSVDGNRYANVTNVSTGQRQLYFVQPLSGARGLITTTNANGTVTKGSNYNNFIQFQGQSKLTNAEINNKKQSNFILSKASTPQELQNLKQSSQYKSGLGNTTKSTSSPDAQSGSTPAPDASKPQPQPQSQTTSSGGTGAVFVYPIGMRATQQDRLKFTAVEYQPSGNLSAGTFSSQNRTSAQGKSIIGTVFLPIQATINDFNSVEWQSGNINAVEKQAVNMSLGAMNAGGVDDLTKVLTDNMSKALKDVSGANKEIKVWAAGEAVGISNLLGRFGTVLNPNLELLFSGPQLRPFDFKFQMSAREKDEGENIKAIINFFKKNMAVKKSDGAGIFLKAPNTFLIEYKYNGADTTHPGINLIKECALLSCSVEYTPLGTYMTYPDGTMVSYSMSLSFSELEPIYSTDYDGHPIGY